MQPSKYQEKILDWLINGKGNGCCNAVAGSGKTVSLKMGAKALQEAGIKPSEIKVIVFGKANSLDLIRKFGSEWKSSISTCHSAGWQMVKRYLDIKNTRDLVSNNKYKKIAQNFDLVARRGLPKGELRKRGVLDKDADFIKLIDLVRLTNQEPSRQVIEDICDHFELPDVWECGTVAEAIADVLDKGEQQARQKMSFDFTDMIWLPVRWNIGQERWFKPYKFVLVDECQDLNATQLELSLALAGKNGRLLYVGDPNQAIMGFAGADCDSYSNILRRVRGTELPLSICYRCPRSHIDLVKNNFSNIPIEASDRAPVGRILQITEKQLFGRDYNGFGWDEADEALRDDDLVLCRKTAPLVSLCIKLISRGIAATVKGRSIGDGLKRDLEDINKMGFPFKQFAEAIAAWQKVKIEQYKFRDNKEQLEEQLQDKCDAIAAIYESQPQAKSIKDLGDYIDDLFSDDHSPITLSTVHRAKGLEAERVFILKPGDMPMMWRNQKEWQKDQEDNILYVALTRSKSDLFIVGNPDWMKEEEEEEEKPKSGSVSIAELQTSWEEKQGISPPMTAKEFCDRCNQSIREHQISQEMIDAALDINPKEAARLLDMPSIAWEEEEVVRSLEKLKNAQGNSLNDRSLNAIFKVAASLLEECEPFAAEWEAAIAGERLIEEEERAETYAKSGAGMNIEYISGQSSHSSTWAKFYVKGLEKWAVQETDDEPQSGNHENYSQYICLDVPENHVFTIFEQDGDKRGTDSYYFHICKASREISEMQSDYSSDRYIQGNFEVIVSGIGKTKAPRLMNWWLEYCGKNNEKGLTNEQKLALAAHCAANINKRGRKELPPFELPITEEKDNCEPLAIETWEEQFKDLPEQLAAYQEPEDIDPLTKAKEAIALLDFETKCELFALLEKEIIEEREERVKAALCNGMGGLSNRAIAKQLGFVSDVTVAKIRRKLIAEGAIAKPETFTDARGYTRKNK